MRADGVLVEPLRVGRIDKLIDKLTITPDLTSTIQIRPNEIDYLRRNQSWLQPVVEASNRPFFAAVLEDIVREVPPPTRGTPLQASDTDVVFYQFAVPDTASDIEFEALLADDYSVDVVGAVQVPFLASGEEDFYYDWHHALRAEGHPSNRANLRQVRFGYGFPTGLSIMGLDFDAQILGFEIKGEFARSTSHLKMPTNQGKRRERESSVFYFNVLKSLHDRVDVGGEWFDIPDDYNTEFPIFQSSGVGPTVGGRLYQPFALVADNDDLDDWPDELEHNDPFDPYFDSQGVGHGVFPGLDLDGDGILDFAATGSGSPFLHTYGVARSVLWRRLQQQRHARPQGERQSRGLYVPARPPRFPRFCQVQSHLTRPIALGLIPDRPAHPRIGQRRRIRRGPVPARLAGSGLCARQSPDQVGARRHPQYDFQLWQPEFAAAGSAREPRRNRQSDLCRGGPVDRARDEHPHYRHLQARRSERQSCGRSPAGIAGDHHTLCHGQQDRLHLQLAAL